MITHNGITLELPLPNSTQIIEQAYLRMISTEHPDLGRGRMDGFIDGAQYILHILKDKT